MVAILYTAGLMVYGCPGKKILIKSVFCSCYTKGALALRSQGRRCASDNLCPVLGHVLGLGPTLYLQACYKQAR